MPQFSLKKWYLDIADDKGDVYIGYYASLKWSHYELNGYAHLWRSPEKGIETQAGITAQPPPQYKCGNQLTWKPEGVDAIWESACEPITATLLDKGDGKIIWHCTQPKARAAINSSRLSFSGWGYTEHINITVPVWKLPFRTLYWGRCHTDTHHLVWIKWEGEANHNLVWFDGKCIRDIIIEDNKITGYGFVLKLGDNVPLREGKVGSTVFRSLGKIIKFLPKTIFLTDEHKWYNRGILECNSQVEPAVIIHEKVSW